MNKERLEILKSYIKAGISPILVQNIPSNSFSNSVILKSNIDISKLNGHYENTEYCPPLWYKELEEKCKKSATILVIENINEAPLKEQTKFIEILKYNKIGTFELPKNCLIIVTCSDLNVNKINELVYSLLSHI